MPIAYKPETLLESKIIEIAQKLIPTRLATFKKY